MDDEIRGHINESLEHLSFFQDFLQHTGMVQEVNEAGFYYGSDWNGGFQIIASHFETCVELLGVSLQGSCEEFSINEEFTGLQNDDGELDISDSNGEPLKFDRFEGHFGEISMLCRISGDSDELEEWGHFIEWLNPIPGSVVGYELNNRGEKQLVWFIDYESGELYERWRTLITAWKVMEFYGNVYRTSEWRRLRGLCESSTDARTTTTDRSERGSSGSLQDSGLGPTAGDVGQLNSREHAERRKESNCPRTSVA